MRPISPSQYFCAIPQKQPAATHLQALAMLAQKTPTHPLYDANETPGKSGIAFLAMHHTHKAAASWLAMIIAHHPLHGDESFF
jgi:hypothetical protein